jgi:hypothetical protein
MQPDPSNLLHRLDITTPLIGFYDAPDPKPFEPIVEPSNGQCMFEFVDSWLEGKTLHLTKERHGCRGAGRSVCGLESVDTDQLVDFLVDEEGLKASKKLMKEWVKSRPPYRPRNEHILIGPINPDQWEYARSISFIVNPDQMSALMTGAQYNSGVDDPLPVLAPFAAGCGLLTAFDSLDIPQAVIGATDNAMRAHLQPDQLLFSVTRSMFKRLCELDESSFLYKSFWTGVRKARGLPDLD